MKFSEIIGSNLKDECFNDLFETYDVDVIYYYDRTYENLPDSYSAQIDELGMEFIFNEEQLLSTLFISNFSPEGFNPFSSGLEELNIFSTKPEALKFANEHDLYYQEGTAEFLGEERDWINYFYDKYTVHYEFIATELSKITIEAKDP